MFSIMLSALSRSLVSNRHSEINITISDIRLLMESLVEVVAALFARC